MRVGLLLKTRRGSWSLAKTGTSGDTTAEWERVYSEMVADSHKAAKMAEQDPGSAMTYPDDIVAYRTVDLELLDEPEDETDG
jgi:hypothetical protein